VLSDEVRTTGMAMALNATALFDLTFLIIFLFYVNDQTIARQWQIQSGPSSPAFYRSICQSVQKRRQARSIFEKLDSGKNMLIHIAVLNVKIA
jgi:hypothetical protein